MTTYPWELASLSHLIYRMTDDEIVAAIREACETPRTSGYLHSMRIATYNRRSALPLQVNLDLLDRMAVAERGDK